MRRRSSSVPARRWSKSSRTKHDKACAGRSFGRPAIRFWPILSGRNHCYSGSHLLRSRRPAMNDATRPQPVGAQASEFHNLHELVRKACHNLDQNAWDYIVGGTETETTLRRNRMALDEIAFRPRVLRDVRKVDGSVEQFGRRMRLPVVLAPVGALEIFDPNGAASVARGAGAFGAAHMLSSVSEPGLEKLAEAAPDALRFYQLYVRGGDAFVEDCVSRAVD